MAVDLQNKLQLLQEYLDLDNTNALDLIKDISELCIEEIDEKNADYCCSHVFNKSTGVTTTIRKIISKDVPALKESLLEFLGLFAEKVGRRIIPYVVDVKEVSVSCFVRDKSNKVKVKSLETLTKVFAIGHASQISKDIKVEELLQKLFSELCRPAKLAATVKKCIFELLGVLAQIYPVEITGHEASILDVFLQNLKQEMTSATKAPTESVIAGCLNGLTSYLYTFNQPVSEGSKESKDIFRYARMAVEAGKESSKQSRYSVTLAGLNMFAKHADQMDVYLTDNYQVMNSTFMFWANHRNDQVKRAATSALEAFLKKVAESLAERAQRGQRDAGVFKYFIGQFHSIMNRSDASPKEIARAIRGYGYFAAPCRIFMTTEDVKFMFNEMIQRSEQVFMEDSQEVDDKLYTLPSFLEALASIAKEMDVISESCLVPLEKLVVMLIEHYPKMGKTLDFIAIATIIKVLLALLPHGGIMRSFLSRIVYQGLIRTCSHPVVIVTEEQGQDVDERPGPKKITYKDYIPLWTGLLDSGLLKELNRMGVTLQDRNALKQMVYHELVSSMLKILGKLDLTSSKNIADESVPHVEPLLSTEESSDPVEGLMAAKPKDFMVFINIVDFCRDFLSEKHIDLFRAWIYAYGREIIILSTRFPLVSGFYKLLSVCMKICGQLKYFQDICCVTSKVDYSMDIDEEDDNNDLVQKQACFQLFSKFAKEVLVRMKQFKDDLLASCLMMVLALPREIVINNMPQIVPAVQSTFKIGLSYLPLAQAGLDALEYYMTHVSPDVLQPYYKDVLPCLDEYLRTTDKGAEDVFTEGSVSFRSSSKNTRGHKRLPMRILRSAKKGLQTHDTQLAIVKQRIVKILGSLGGQYNAALLCSDMEEIAKAAVAWDTTSHLKFDMPFIDFKPTMYLDPFLPRVTHLAVASSDRQTKVAACELLHSLILFMLGRGVQGTGETSEPMDQLYRKCFPSLLKLASDVEQVARQLFDPLVFQLIHWFTQNRRFESPETMALLDAILEGISQPSDSALRDFAARCVNEFLKWSIKQTSKQTQAKSPNNTKSLLKRLYSYALHPSSFKRFGAALAFNNIYKVLREEDSLVDSFIFEILYKYVESLAIAHNDEKSLGTQETGKQVLDHIERIISKKAAMLNKDKERRKPKIWSKCNLEEAVKWLLEQCGRPQTVCRHACMELVFKLAPCLPGISRPDEYFKKKLKENGAGFFIARLELDGSVSHRGGIAKYPKLSDVSDGFNLRSTQQWFDSLLAALDCYTWVFGQDLLTPSDILGKTGSSANIFQCVQYFLTHLALSDIEEASRVFKVKTPSAVFTPHETEEYNRAKCTVIVRLINFLCVLMAKYPKDFPKVVPPAVWSDSLWQLVCKCILAPSSVGFNMGDVEIVLKLPEECEQLLRVFSRFLPPDSQPNFKKCLSQQLEPNSSCDLLSHLQTSFDEDFNPLHVLQLVSGYECLQKTGYLVSLGQSGRQRTSQQLAAEILKIVFDGVVKNEENTLHMVRLSPTINNLCQRLLDLVFMLNIQISEILKVLLDKTPVSSPTGKGESAHGTLFFNTFKVTISSHLVPILRELVPELVKYIASDSVVITGVLHGILDCVIKDRNLRKKYGMDAVGSILSCWSSFMPWCCAACALEQKQSVLILLKNVFIIDAKVAKNPDHPAFKHVFEMFRTMLTDTKTSLTFKSSVFDLLPFFTSLPETQLNLLKDSLNVVVADNFSQKSCDLVSGTPRYQEYSTALSKLFSCLEMSRSLMVLEILISVVCRETVFVMDESFQDSLETFVKSSPMDKHKAIINVPYAIFKNETFPKEIRRATLEKVCLPFLRLVHVSTLTEFFTPHIKEIMTILESKLTKGSEVIMENQLVSKICCLEMLEVIYARLPKEEVFSTNSRLCQAYCDGRADTGKELTMAVTKLTNNIKCEDMRGETVLLDLRRQYHCAAYNALIATIICTQTDIKFYIGFLFKDAPEKGQFLLENVIDQSKDYRFSVTFDSLPSRKKTFSAIRRNLHAQKDTQGSGEEDDVSPASEGPDYLASQYLADSSLCEDINPYSFANQSISGSQQRLRNLSQRTPSTQDEEGLGITSTGNYVEMEMDELNQHPCMSSLVTTIRHMKENVLPTGDSQPAALASWMNYFQKKLNSPTTPRNVKLFIAKLIINLEEVFRPYAKFWLNPLIHLVVTEKDLSEGINYFLVDVIVTLLSWSNVAIPEDRSMASRLVEFIMANSHHEMRPILKRNIEMVKTLVECWKDRIDVPTKIIHANMSDRDPKSSRNATGIQLLGVVLANKLPPYTFTPSVDRDSFFKTLALNMSNHFKLIYAAAAEVVGMTLRYLSENDVAYFEEYRDFIVSGLGSDERKIDSLVHCVYKMNLHFPPIADKFLNKLLFYLPKLHGDIRHQCLEIIQMRIDVIDQVFLEMKNKGITDMLQHREEQIQLSCLKIVNKMLPKLKASEVLFLLPDVVGCHSLPSGACRKVMYDILIWIYDSYREDSSEVGFEVMAMVKENLLKGLSDKDLHNRLTVQNFWTHETRLPAGTLDRLVAMLEAMYSPATELQYLSYATNLVLEMTSKSPDFNRLVFEQPLSDCKYEDYDVQSSWRQRHAAMTPLFADTQASGSQGNDSPPESLAKGVVRATMDVQFTATQEVGSKAPYNWLTQSSLDTFGDFASQSVDSSLMFNVGKTPRKGGRNKVRVAGTSFGQRQAGMDSVDSGAVVEDSSQQEIQRLKRRFLKEQKTSSKAFFSRVALQKQRRRQEVAREQKARRENQVTMYRQYRRGDLPDIQIKYSYIIAPLQALAQRDSSVAKTLFSLLFRAVFTEIEREKRESEVQKVTEQINQSLKFMLENSTTYYAPFIGCILDIVYYNPKKLELDPGLVNISAVTSLQQPLGIILLEESLLHFGTEDQRPNKRARTTVKPTPKETTAWIELARLYRSLGDYDVLRGIFAAKIGSQPITLEALELESQGEFNKASELYSEALGCTDWEDEPTQGEVDLWDDCYLRCLDNLTKWEALDKHTVTSIDPDENLSKVWDDTYYQEHYMPFLIRSKLKLIVDQEQQALPDFIDDSMKHPDRKAWIENNYSEEIALLYLWQEDFDRARHYTNCAVDSFLQEWSSLDSLMTSSRATRLHSLQKLTEMQEFLSIVQKDDQELTTALVDKWMKRLPDNLNDPSSIWDDIIYNRCMFMSVMESRLEDDTATRWLPRRLMLHLSQAESACEQDNLSVALKKLSETHKLAGSINDEYFALKWSHVYAKTQQKRAQRATDPTECVKYVLNSLDRMDKCKDKSLLSSDFALGRSHHVLNCKGYETLCLLLHDNQDLDCYGAQLAPLMKRSGVTRQKVEEILSGLINNGYKSIQEAVSLAVQEHDSGVSQDKAGIIDAYMTLVTYCDQFLKLHEDENSIISKTTIKTFPSTVMSSLLRGMKLDSVQARQRFPRLLQLVEYYPETMDTFVKMSSEVPSWMFINWLSQMVAILDKKESPAVHHILLDLAKEYPQAVVYPFKISSEYYKFADNHLGKRSKQIVDKLRDILSKVTLVDKLIAALDQFTNPSALFSDWSMRMMKVYKSTKPDTKAIQESYCKLYANLMESGPGASGDDLFDSQITNGKFRQNYAREYKTHFVQKFGKKGEKILGMDKKKFYAACNELKTKQSKLIEPKNVKEYCDWMNDFKPTKYEDDLEIPGQYTGFDKPLPEYHVKIAGFDEKVLVLSSIRKPKRITIRGNDEKDHKFMIKGGEDLRQDQRIEQLFGLMNEVFAQDSVCRQKNLKIATYQVIPMTPRVGMIEWVNHTKTWKEVLQHELALNRAENDNYRKAMDEYKGMIQFRSKYPNYNHLYKGMNLTKISSTFASCESKVAWDLSRRAFIKMTSSPEAFFTLRNHFAMSYAVLCICQYIIGIGDRHQSNFMLDIETGRAVGIDFGHAFGSATLVLPVPELMPFRMTRQLVNLMMPMKTKGLIESSMVNALRALRKDHQLLLTVMDVFIKDPCVDWMELASKLGQDQDDDGQMSDFCRQQILSAKQKLEGHNSTFIMSEEISRRADKDKSIQDCFRSVLKGDSRMNLRAKLPEKGLTVEQQVACLLDHATDPSILGRTWEGWEPFV